jgi:hypothetical protein
MNGEKRIETKTSRTASYTCFARGCATREKDPRFRGPDYLAEEMFPFLARLSLNFSPARKFLMRRMFPPGIYAYVLVRTRVMDSVFSEALDAHVAQIVLLGAGFARPGRAGPGIRGRCVSRTATGGRGSSNWTFPRHRSRNGTFFARRRYPSPRS